MVKKRVEKVESVWDPIEMILIKMYLWLDFGLDWFFSRWDKWIHIAILIALTVVAMNINFPTLAIAAFFLAVGYGLGWFIAKVKK